VITLAAKDQSQEALMQGIKARIAAAKEKTK
jgi:hypothetical protein